MTKGKNGLSCGMRVCRRSFVKGLGATGAALSMPPRWSFADDYAAMYANAAIDWKQFSGQTITLAGATHPWSNAITPLLQNFTDLTAIRVVREFELETKFLGAFPITSEVMTLFINSDALAAKNLTVPRTFDDLLAAAKAVKTSNMSGIAMRAKASGNSSPAAMGFVFSYGGAMIKDNKAAFDSSEAIAAIEMYGQLLSQTGPVGVGTYEWYEVLNDFLQGRTAMAIDSSILATDVSNPAKSRVARQAGFAAFPHLPDRAAVPMMLHWQACINAKSRSKKAAFLFLLWATSKPTSLQTAAVGLGTTRLSAWSSEGFKRAFGEQAAAAALINLQDADVDRAKAILFHLQSRPIQDAFMIGVNEVVSGTKSAKDAMTAAAAKANAAIRG